MCVLCVCVCVCACFRDTATTHAALSALRCCLFNACQAGCATLREAAELSGAFRRVEEVFAAGDLPRVADMLCSMAKRYEG